MAINVSDVVVRDAQGAERRLGEWAGQVLLIVNVASRCGFTRQYAGLQTLQDTYGPVCRTMTYCCMYDVCRLLTFVAYEV